MSIFWRFIRFFPDGVCRILLGSGGGKREGKAGTGKSRTEGAERKVWVFVSKLAKKIKKISVFVLIYEKEYAIIGI